jgi:hypothetical protein
MAPEGPRPAVGGYRVEPFVASHYVKAVSNLPPLPEFAPWSIGIKAEAGGPAWTGLVNDEVACCAGVMLLYSGVGEAWAVMTNVGRQHSLFVHRQVSRILRDIIRHQRLRRVQADVIESFVAGRRWAESLGFTQESEMRLAGPRGETLVRYAMFPKLETP